MKHKEMKRYLQNLLNQLEALGSKYDELYYIRENLHGIIFLGYVENKKNFDYPKYIGMSSQEAHNSVIEILKEYINNANKYTEEKYIENCSDRLKLFEDSSVCTEEGEQYFDDFFGYAGKYNQGLFDGHFEKFYETTGRDSYDFK